MSKHKKMFPLNRDFVRNFIICDIHIYVCVYKDSITLDKYIELFLIYFNATIILHGIAFDITLSSNYNRI